MIVITITNQKGGVAKTTTASALGFGLVNRGYRVLFIDTDAQCNLTDNVYPVNEQGEIIREIKGNTINEVMQKQCKISEAIYHTKYENADLVAASLFLTEIDMKLINSIESESILQKALQEIEEQYDFCIIDTPPSLGWMTINALTASDYMIIPTFTEKFSIMGIKQLYDNYLTISNTVNTNLKLLGFLITRHKAKSTVARETKEILEDLAKDVGVPIFKAVIREQVAINEAQFAEVNIYDYLKKPAKRVRGNVADDYNSFVDEVIERIGEAK